MGLGLCDGGDMVKINCGKKIKRENILLKKPTFQRSTIPLFHRRGKLKSTEVIMHVN